LDKKTTMLSLIDDCRNKWDCVVVFGTVSDQHYIIGGQWKRTVDSRRIHPGSYMIIGSPTPGNHKIVYFSTRSLCFNQSKKFSLALNMK